MLATNLKEGDYFSFIETPDVTLKYICRHSLSIDYYNPITNKTGNCCWKREVILQYQEAI